MKTKPVATPIQAYIINHDNRDIVQAFKASQTGAIGRLLRGILEELGNDTFVSNASLIEDFKIDDKIIDFQLEGFTTIDSKFSFYVENENDIKQVLNDLAAENKHKKLTLWASQNINTFQQSMPRQTYKMVISGLVSEIIDFISLSFIEYIESMIEINGIGKPNKGSEDKEKVVLFLAASTLEVASLGHTLANQLGYKPSMHEAIAANDPQTIQLHTNFFTDNLVKIRAYFGFLAHTTDQSVQQLLKQVCAVSSYKTINLQALQQIMEYGVPANEKSDYGAHVIVKYINNDIHLKFMDFLDAYQSADGVDTTTKPLITNDDIRTQAYNEGYAKAKADMLLLFNQL